jgi:hypothetical protein
MLKSVEKDGKEVLATKLLKRLLADIIKQEINPITSIENTQGKA